MSHYPIAKDFRNIDVSMPYHKLLFPLAGPVLKLMAHCVPLLKGLTVSKRSVPGFQGKPFSVELYRPTGAVLDIRRHRITSVWPWRMPSSWAV